jgi:hypothetical protein
VQSISPRTTQENNNMRGYLRTAGIVIALAVWNHSEVLASTCGRWDRVDSERKFAVEPFGTLAFVRGANYFILTRDQCINLDASGQLYFAINHNGTPEVQPSFVSVHTALVKIGGANPDTQYLYRNTGYWNKDKSGLRYSSTHRMSDASFNADLNGDPTAFDGRYHDDVGRTWNDSVNTTTTPPLTFQSWNYRSTFSTKQELADAVRQKTIGLATQNYLVSFKARGPAAATADAGSPPGFSVNTSGYDCLFIRVSGTSNMPEIRGGYMVHLRSGKSCDNVISGFTSLSSWWASLTR